MWRLRSYYNKRFCWRWWWYGCHCHSASHDNALQNNVNSLWGPRRLPEPAHRDAFSRLVVVVVGWWSTWATLTARGLLATALSAWTAATTVTSPAAVSVTTAVTAIAAVRPITTVSGATTARPAAWRWPRAATRVRPRTTTHNMCKVYVIIGGKL